VVGLAQRFDAIRDTVGPLCVGIDPSRASLAQWGLSDSAAGALEMARVIVAVSTDRVGIVKPQVAYFERFGSAGFAALETVIAEASDAGLCVIADAKRGDIGSTMDAYAETWLGTGPLSCHAMTASPYLGFGPLETAFRAAEETQSTVFVLAVTSNPDSRDVQHATVRDTSVAQYIVNEAHRRNSGTNTVGVVVGATRSLNDSGIRPDSLNGLLILAPGFGAQGASLRDLDTIFGVAHDTVIPSVSRSVLHDGPHGVGAAIDSHRQELGL